MRSIDAAAIVRFSNSAYLIAVSHYKADNRELAVEKISELFESAYRAGFSEGRSQGYKDGLQTVFSESRYDILREIVDKLTRDTK